MVAKQVYNASRVLQSQILVLSRDYRQQVKRRSQMTRLRLKIEGLVGVVTQSCESGHLRKDFQMDKDWAPLRSWHS